MPTPTPPETECPACDGSHVQARAWWETTDYGPVRYQPVCETCADRGVIEVDECQVEEPSDADAA